MRRYCLIFRIASFAMVCQIISWLKRPKCKKKSDQSGPRLLWITPDTHISEDLDWTSKTSVDYPPPPLGVLQVDRAGAWLTDIWLLLAEDYLAAPTHKKLAAAPLLSGIAIKWRRIFRKRLRLRWSTRRQSVLPCDVSIQCLCQILRSWSVPHVSVSIPAISVRSSGHPL